MWCPSTSQASSCASSSPGVPASSVSTTTSAGPSRPSPRRCRGASPSCSAAIARRTSASEFRRRRPPPPRSPRRACRGGRRRDRWRCRPAARRAGRLGALACCSTRRVASRSSRCSLPIPIKTMATARRRKPSPARPLADASDGFRTHRVTSPLDRRHVGGALEGPGWLAPGAVFQSELTSREATAFVHIACRRRCRTPVMSAGLTSTDVTMAGALEDLARLAPGGRRPEPTDVTQRRWNGELDVPLRRDCRRSGALVVSTGALPGTSTWSRKCRCPGTVAGRRHFALVTRSAPVTAVGTGDGDGGR